MENKFYPDDYNKRFISYIVHFSEKVLKQEEKLKKKDYVDKSIVYTLLEHAHSFKEIGYQREGLIKGFFSGEDAVILSKFFDPSREKSTSLQKDKVLEIVNKDKKSFENLDLDQNQFQLAILDEHGPVDELCNLYKKVFSYYPIDIFNTDYVESLLRENTIFVVALNKGKIVSAASAMIDTNYLSAEITDCITDPKFRGNNLLAHIIRKLEKLLKSKNILSLYSLTRADSVGMNLNIKRLGYTYHGTLVNNCKIFSGYEDMNVWSKRMDS